VTDAFCPNFKFSKIPVSGYSHKRLVQREQDQIQKFGGKPWCHDRILIYWCGLLAFKSLLFSNNGKSWNHSTLTKSVNEAFYPAILIVVPILWPHNQFNVITSNESRMASCLHCGWLTSVMLVLREKMKPMVTMTIMTMTMDSLFHMATYQMTREWRMEMMMIVEKMKRIRYWYNLLTIAN